MLIKEIEERLTGMEIRGMERFATDEPSANWGPEFWTRFEKWSNELRLLERIYTNDRISQTRPAPRQQGERS